MHKKHKRLNLIISVLALLTFVSLCIVCWSSTIDALAHRQDAAQLTEVDFRVKDVALGSTYAVVLRQLGRPVSSKREKMLDDTCGPPSTSLRLSYKGAVVELRGDLAGRNFEVVSMEVTSSSLLITPGIKIGMTEEDARSKLGGAPWRVMNESGFRILDYVTQGNDGGARLYFRDRRLVKVHWNYTLC